MPTVYFDKVGTEHERAVVKHAFDVVPGFLDVCLTDLRRGGSPHVQRWFGGGAGHLDFVTRVFTEMKKWMGEKTFNITTVANLKAAPSGVTGAVKMAGEFMRQECSGGGTNAVRFKAEDHVGSGVRMYLNLPAFAADPEYGALTVVHECCHKISSVIIDYNFEGIPGRAYNAGWCEYYAANDPNSAICNAENYALYCGDLNKKLRFLKTKCDGRILPVDFKYTDGTPL
jgi:hypothetical protein